MYKYLILLGVLVSQGVWAQSKTSGGSEVVVEDHDKEKDIFYKFGGGVRLRHYITKDSTAGALPFVEDFSNTAHRAQLDVQLNKGEYFQSYIRAIHHSIWGEDNNTDQNNFTLQQAWGNWKVTDFLNFKFGRQAVELGRGLSYGANEWENVPTFYDGFATLFDWDVLELSLYALKIDELERDPTQSVSSDPETNHYVIDINFKELSDIIQMADLNFVQVVSDIGLLPGSTTLVNKQRIQRFGFDFVLSGVYFEAATSINYITGTESTFTTSNKVKQMMLDSEFRFKMPDWQQLNLWAGAHYDTGDDNATDGTNTQYQALNYNYHQNAGRLDFFRFGNLTYLRAGASMHMMSDWYFGIEGFMFQKTKESAPNYLERGLVVSNFENGTIQFGAEKNLGTEIDLWIGKSFPSGLNMELSFNYLAPGTAMERAIGVAARPMDRPIYNLIFDLGYFF